MFPNPGSNTNIKILNSQSDNQVGYQVPNEWVTYMQCMDMKNEGMSHVLGVEEWENMRFHHSAANCVKFNTEERYFWSFPFTFSNYGCLEATNLQGESD